MDFQRDPIKFIGVLTGYTEGAPVVVSTGIKFTSPLNLRTRRAHAYRSRRAALLCETNVVVESPGRCSHRAGRVTWQGLMRGTPLDHRCGRVAKLALERRRVQWHCPRAPTPEPGKGRRPKNRHSSKAKRVSALVSCLFPVLACLCRGFPGSGSLVSPALPLRVPLCFCSASCFFLLAAGVTFQLPAGGTSGQAQGHRPKNRYRAPTQGPAFTGTPLCTTFLRTSLCLNCSFPCTLLFIFRVCFGHCSGYLRHRQLRAQWYKTSPQVLSGFLSLSWRSTGCLGWRKTLSMVSPFTLQGYRATCISLVVLDKALVKLWISRGVIDHCRSLVFYTGFLLLVD